MSSGTADALEQGAAGAAASSAGKQQQHVVTDQELFRALATTRVRLERRRWLTHVALWGIVVVYFVSLWGMSLLLDASLASDPANKIPAADHPGTVPSLLYVPISPLQETCDKLSPLAPTPQAVTVLTSGNMPDWFADNLTSVPPALAVAGDYNVLAFSRELCQFDQGFLVTAPIQQKHLPGDHELDTEIFHTWLDGTPDAPVIGGFRWSEAGDSVGVVYNSTLTQSLDAGALLTRFVVSPLISQGAANFTALERTGQRQFPYSERVVTSEVLQSFIPLVVMILLPIAMPSMLYALVYDRDAGLLGLSLQMGMKLSVYNTVSYVSFFLVNWIPHSIVVYVSAIALDMHAFTRTQPGLMILFLLLLGLSLVSTAFFLASLVSKRRYANLVGYLLVLMSVFVYSALLADFVSSDTLFLSWIGRYSNPLFTVGWAATLLSNAVAHSGPGLNFDNISEVGFDSALAALAVQAVVLLALALVRPIAAIHPRTTSAEASSNVLKLEHLSHRYPGAPVDAIKDVSFTVEENSCFGFLGENGSGKSTAIQCISGVNKNTGGAVTLRSGSLGVCPQDDVLWDTLTCREHLEYYSVIKGAADGDGEALLKQLQLASVADRRVSALSGGMKRRLSVAIALVGSPDLILLDEPSTGLDVATRSHLWEVILERKKSAAILLTTHALEEAEAVCDTVGILNEGTMVCVDSPVALRHDYAVGYELLVVADHENNTAIVDAFVDSLAPGNVTLLHRLGGTATWRVSNKSLKLSDLVKRMQTESDKAHIEHWGLSATTLETVFVEMTTSKSG